VTGRDVNWLCEVPEAWAVGRRSSELMSKGWAGSMQRSGIIVGAVWR
jgi:hypothetical protein